MGVHVSMVVPVHELIVGIPTPVVAFEKVIDAKAIDSLNVNTTDAVGDTPVAPLAGTTETMVGAPDTRVKARPQIKARIEGFSNGDGCSRK